MHKQTPSMLLALLIALRLIATPMGVATGKTTLNETYAKYEEEIVQHKEQIMFAHLARLRAEELEVRRNKAAIKLVLAYTVRDTDDRRRYAFEKQLAKLQNDNDDIADARDILLSLMQDRDRYNDMVVEELTANKESAPTKRSARFVIGENTGEYALSWPVLPEDGISANFMDKSYSDRFGMEHYAIDIPVPQGSDVVAASNGVVLEVNDREYGYSTIYVKHNDKLVSVYGHVSKILVKEGDNISAGETIAYSGGRPGSKGAGIFTTGPHLHFETRIYGEAIDPLYYLPPVIEQIASVQ